jgi:hypothetical protein
MMRLPWYRNTVPHAVVDILRGCNCRCENCYNNEMSKIKSLEEIKAELRVILASRHVKTVSISGGEPLLHPRILEIVSYLHNEVHVSVSLLTNGMLFDEDTAAKLSAAGLDFITFHIQKGQIRSDCDDASVEKVRNEKGRLARKYGIYPAVVETIRFDDRNAFADIGRFLRSSPEFEYALVTVARDFSRIDLAAEEPDFSREPMLGSLAEEGYLPSVFVGGRFFKDIPRWYILQSVQATDASGEEKAWSVLRPGFLERSILFLSAKIFRRSIHWVKSTSLKTKIRLLLNGMTGGRIATLFFVLRSVFRGWSLREKHIIVQYPPRSLGDGRVEFCDGCPDATVKDGSLCPLCLADSDLKGFEYGI